MQKNQKLSASSSSTSSVEIAGIAYNYISLNGSAFEVDVPDLSPPCFVWLSSVNASLKDVFASERLPAFKRISDIAILTLLLLL